MPVLHLLHGYMGSGKTTFAKTLEAETKAVRLTHDEFMVQLYGREPMGDQFSVCYDRVDTLIFNLAEKILRSGGDVIIDYGFWTRAARDRARKLGADIGAETRLYALSAPEDVMRARVLRRSKSETGELDIDAATFDALKSRFEPLAPDELAIKIETS